MLCESNEGVVPGEHAKVRRLGTVEGKVVIVGVSHKSGAIGYWPLARIKYEVSELPSRYLRRPLA
jgi:hypothetical protein